MITEENELKQRQAAALQNSGFYWRERDSVRARLRVRANKSRRFAALKLNLL